MRILFGAISVSDDCHRSDCSRLRTRRSVNIVFAMIASNHAVGDGHEVVPRGRYTVPYSRSPKSPSPGTMNFCALSSRSTTGV